MYAKLKVLETVFLPQWNGVAYLCEGRQIYIELITNRFFTKEKLLSNRELFDMTDKHFNKRLALFEELEVYYDERYPS